MPRHRAAPASLVVLAAGALAGLGAWVALRQPPRVTHLLSRSGTLVFSVRTTARRVAITIDDGPTSGLTPRLLDVLDRHGARATFFVLGSGVRAHPEVVAAAHAARHDIGNHGWSDRPAALLSRAELRADLGRTATAIAAVTGAEPRLVRPGSGWLTPGQLRDVHTAGLTVVLGCVATLDLRVTDLDRELRFIVDRLRPGAIIVLHEGRGDRAGVVPLLDRLLTEVALRGYEAVTLSELLEAPGAGGRRSGLVWASPGA